MPDTTPAPAVAAADEIDLAKNVEAPRSSEGIIDEEVLSQIRDMDEDDEDDEEGEPRSFSKGIVWGYFEQAENTFEKMEEAIAENSLSKLSSLGHFLKGSSAALGIIRVHDICEKMQHYGNKRDEEEGEDLDEEEAMRRIKALLVACKKDYVVARAWLKRLYEEEEAEAAAAA